MPLKPKIANIIKRSNSFCDGSKYETGTQPLIKVEHSVHDCYSTDAIDVVKCKKGLVNATMGWCGGDFNEDGTLERDIVRNVTEGEQYKNSLVDELYKSNHELRIKLAGAENKIAQLRLRIEAHCECCSRGLGVEDYAEQKEYNDWSSGYSGMETFHQMNTLFRKSRDYNGMPSDASPYLSKTTEDILNPYIKVKRWQDAMDSRNVKENESSTGSTYALKYSSRPLSPHNVSARSAPVHRAESPSSGVSNDFVLPNSPVASRSNAPNVIDTSRRYESSGQVDKNRCYQRKSFELGGNIKVEPCEDPIPVNLRRGTTETTPEEWNLSPSHNQRQSDSFQSTNLNSNESFQVNFAHSDRGEHQLFMNQYNHPIRQRMHKSIYQEQNPWFRKWGQQNEMASGIVGKLMKLREGNEELVQEEPI